MTMLTSSPYPQKPRTLLLPPNGSIPNNEKLPALIYTGVLPASDDLASTAEALLTRNGWPTQWRDIVLPYHHYHSTAAALNTKDKNTPNRIGVLGPYTTQGPSSFTPMPVAVLVLMCLSFTGTKSSRTDQWKAYIDAPNRQRSEGARRHGTIWVQNRHK